MDMASTFLVIGLGRFGTNLALRLMDSGSEVMVIDTDEDSVNRLAPHVTQAKIGDCMDEEVLRSLDPASFDFCFVCISDNFQSSLEITSLLKEMGAPMVISKADKNLHARLLRKIGALYASASTERWSTWNWPRATPFSSWTCPTTGRARPSSTWTSGSGTT